MSDSGRAINGQKHTACFSSKSPAIEPFPFEMIETHLDKLPIEKGRVEDVSTSHHPHPHPRPGLASNTAVLISFGQIAFRKLAKIS